MMDKVSRFARRAAWCVAVFCAAALSLCAGVAAESVWIGGSSGLWNVSGNWSAGAIPGEETTVVFTNNATVGIGTGYYTDITAKALAIVANADVTFRENDADYSKYPVLKVFGSGISGTGTVTLERIGFYGNNGAMVIETPLVIKGDGASNHDTFLSNATFTFQNIVRSSDGALKLISDCVFRGDIVLDGNAIMFYEGTPTQTFRGDVHLEGNSTLKTRAIHFGNRTSLYVGEDATFSFASATQSYDYGFEMKGSGRIICVGAVPSGTLLECIQDPSRWTGTCELNSVASDSWNLSTYGNSESYVALNGITGKFTTDLDINRVADGIKGIVVESGGLNLSTGDDGDGYWVTDKKIVIASPVTGSGPIRLGLQSNCGDPYTSVEYSPVQYVFTGDMSGFDGALSFKATLYRPCCAFATEAEITSVPKPTDYGQIIVMDNATANVSGTWNAPGGFIVRGEMVVNALGVITSDNGVFGAGKIVYSVVPTSVPPINESWSGTVEILETDVIAKRTLPLAGLGVAGSKIIIDGITTTNSSSISLSGNININAEVELRGDLMLTDGSSSLQPIFASLTGSGKLYASTDASASSSAKFKYSVLKFDDYEGEAEIVRTASSSKFASLEITNINKSAWAPGDPVLRMASGARNANVTTVISNIIFTIGGTPSGYTLFMPSANSDNNIYVALLQNTANSTYYQSLEAAANANVASFKILDGIDESIFPELEVAGYDYNSGTRTFTKNASYAAAIGTKSYTTLADALADAVPGDRVFLLKNNTETGTFNIPEGVVLDTVGFATTNTVASTATFSGAGTIRAAKSITPKFADDWTGKFIIDWKISSGKVYLNNYGNENSTVELGTEMTGGYLCRAATESTTITIYPKIVLSAPMTFTDGYAYAGNDTIFKKIFIGKNGALNMTRTPSNPAADKIIYFQMEDLQGCYGSMTIGNYNHLTIASLNVTNEAQLASGECLAAITMVSGAGLNVEDTVLKLNGVEVSGARVVYGTVDGESGLYRAFWQGTSGATTNRYITLAEAVADAGSLSEIKLLANTEEDLSDVEVDIASDVTLDLDGRNFMLTGGSGTLTKKGTGTLTFANTSNLSGTLTVKVEKDGGEVDVPSGSSIVPGEGTTTDGSGNFVYGGDPLTSPVQIGMDVFPMSTALEAANGDDLINLVADVALSSTDVPVVIESNRIVRIALNGYSVTRTGTANAVEVRPGAKLTIEDEGDSDVGRGAGTSEVAGTVKVEESTLVLNGGKFTSCVINMVASSADALPVVKVKTSISVNAVNNASDSSLGFVLTSSVEDGYTVYRLVKPKAKVKLAMTSGGDEITDESLPDDVAKVLNTKEKLVSYARLFSSKGGGSGFTSRSGGTYCGSEFDPDAEERIRAALNRAIVKVGVATLAAAKEPVDVEIESEIGIYYGYKALKRDGTMEVRSCVLADDTTIIVTIPPASADSTVMFYQLYASPEEKEIVQ